MVLMSKTRQLFLTKRGEVLHVASSMKEDRCRGFHDVGSTGYQGKSRPRDLCLPRIFSEDTGMARRISQSKAFKEYCYSRSKDVPRLDSKLTLELTKTSLGVQRLPRGFIKSAPFCTLQDLQSIKNVNSILSFRLCRQT